MSVLPEALNLFASILLLKKEGGGGRAVIHFVWFQSAYWQDELARRNVIDLEMDKKKEEEDEWKQGH